MIVGTSEFPHVTLFFLTYCFLTSPLSFGLLLRGQAESFNVNDCCFILFKLEDKEKLDEEVISFNGVP